MEQIQRQQSRWPKRLRITGFIIALLILLAGAVFLALNSGHSLPAIIATIFGTLAVIITFVQLWPIIFPPKPPDPVPAPQVNVTVNIPGAQSLQSPVAPESPNAHIPAIVPSQPVAEPLTLRAQPLPTGEQHIQQRTVVVKEVYDMLIAPDTAAVALYAIGGIGKSTLAALVLEHAGRERRAGRGPFRAEAILLRINENTTFSELATNLFAATGKPMPDFSQLPAQNQAFSVFNALNTADPPRLIVLDQFENFLDEQSGRSLPASIGIGEFLDALNSRPCASRILLTSRARPCGARDDDPTALAIYRVGGLTEQEGSAYLHSYGVTATDADLRKAVRRCQGHGFALKLMRLLLELNQMSLATLLHDPEYEQLWRDQIAENLLDRVFKKLSVQSQQLLCAFSVYREAVPIDAALAIIPGATKVQALTTLQALLSQHLIQAANGLNQLHPIVAVYAEQHFITDGILSTDDAARVAHEQAAQYYLQLASTSRPSGGWERIAEVQPLIEAVWQFCKAGKYQEAYQLMDGGLFDKLKLWGGNVILLELYQLFLSDNWQPTAQQKLLIYNNLGSVYDALGQKAKASRYYEQALALSREAGDRRAEGTVLNNLGTVYDALGKKQEALLYNKQGLMIHQEVGNRQMEGTALNNLGLVYNALGKKQEALGYYEQALQIFGEVGDRGGEGTTLNNLGLVYDDLGKKQEALGYYEQALQIRREVGDRGGEGTTLWNIGAASFVQQRYDVALACYLLAKEIYRQVQSPLADNVERWIESLRNRVGEKQFAALFTQVENHEEEIVDQALREIRQSPSFEDQRPEVRDEDEEADDDGEHGDQ